MNETERIQLLKTLKIARLLASAALKLAGANYATALAACKAAKDMNDDAITEYEDASAKYAVVLADFKARARADLTASRIANGAKTKR
jgi:hypothetical protein